MQTLSLFEIPSYATRERAKADGRVEVASTRSRAVVVVGDRR
jgi:hypothetical protein